MGTKQKVLVVEDNAPLTKSLVGWLKKSYKVDTANTGKMALNKVKQETYQLIILDLGLPDIPGQQVCNAIREAEIATPILVLTAEDSVSTRVDLLDMGADDYLLKPFYIGELQARLRALIRRQVSDKTRETGTLTIADLQLEPARRIVERNGKVIQLRPKEFDILEYLLRNKRTVVTRPMIINNAWEVGADRWNNTVDVHIKYLRDKVDKPFKQKLIKTAYGAGYLIDDNL